MSLFDDLFSSRFVFDNDYQQRRDIEALRYEVATRDSPKVRALERRVDQLQLLCHALSEVIERKQLASREELEVLVQQIDLMDGVEDGKQGATWKRAPRCPGCNYFINPRREACLYCGRSAREESRPDPAPSAPARTARCGKCASVVPQNQTFFTEQGVLWCASCVRTG